MDFETKRKRFLARVLAPVLAGAMVIGVGVYELAKPAAAATVAAPAPAAAPLDDNSVAPLLAFDKAMETLAARVTPAIVNVTVTSKSKPAAMGDEGDGEAQGPGGGMEQFFGNPFGGMQMMPRGQQQPHIEHGLGSGVIISPDGYIVTNNHVVEGEQNISVTLNDRRILPAKVIGTDPLTDLAVIKVNATGLPSVPWGDSTQLHPGQLVLAFGNPYGFRFTVTRGIISALNRPNPESDRRKPGAFIQTDAAINPGNSGGPLVDARGEVIGINTFLISPSGSFTGMGFAIPTQIVKPTVDTLIKYGKVSHGYMGIGISDVTPENSKFFDLKKAEGAVVTQVEPNSPGAKAGLKTGDVITQLDGQPVADAGTLQVEVGQKQPGATIKLGVMRNGSSETIPVTLGSMDKGKGEESASTQNGKPRWGLGLEDLSPDVRQELQAPQNVAGAVVGNVQPGSPADNAGLQRGDIILEVNRKAVKSAADASQALKSVPSGQEALVLVWSQGGNTFRVLHPNG
jgi:serine protease Do